MAVSHLQNYTLMDLLRSEGFYKNIIAGRDITRASNCESSFCVWGDAQSCTFTSAFKEQADSCDFQEEENGIHPHPGWGLYTPEGKSRLIDLHFHPDYLLLDNIGIPSREDFSDQLKVSSKNFQIHLSSNVASALPRVIDRDGKTYSNHGQWFNLVSIIGYYSAPNNQIRLFFGQYVNPDFSPRRNLPARLSRLMFQELGNKGRGYDILDQQLPRKAARVLSATGKYRAEVISFKNRSEYFFGLKKLEEWSF